MADNEPLPLNPEPEGMPLPADAPVWETWHAASDQPRELLGDRYSLEEEIGAGASSITFRGWDERLDRQVAIKILRTQYVLDQAFVRRFEREARAAAAISHPHVVHMYDFGSHGDRLYIVMEYIEGETLKERLTKVGPFPPLDAIRIMRHVLAGLTAIHRAGIIHRDIKPQNILIGTDGIARVADFGIVHLITETGLTSAGTTLGTAAYMAPEQAQGGPLVPATDLYAVGVVLYELLTGHVPFEAPSAVGVIYAHMYARPLPPSQRVPGRATSPDLDQLVLRALAKQPGKRFASAPEMRRALAVDLRSLGAGPVQHVHRHMPGALTLMLLCLVVAGAAGAWVLGRDPAGTKSALEPTLLAVADVPTGAADETMALDDLIVLPSAAMQVVPTETPAPMVTKTTIATSTDMPVPTEPLRLTSTSVPTQAPVPTDTPVPTVTPVPTQRADDVVAIVPIEGGEDDATQTEAARNDNLIVDDQGEAQAIESLGEDPTPDEGVDEDDAGTSIQVSFPASDWQGAYFQMSGNIQPWAAVYAQSTGYGSGSLSFSLQTVPASETFVLTIEGMTSENWDALPVALRVNGQEVYTGSSPFPTWNGVEGAQPWTSISFELPARLLRPGQNTVTFVNMVGEGSFGLPPYVLLAEATVTMDGVELPE